MHATRIAALCLSGLMLMNVPGLAADAPKPRKAEVSRTSSRDVACLAEAVYFEAGGSNERGAVAVAHVVVNRANSSKFPGSVCGVVADGCQFSYRCDGRSDALSNPQRRAMAVQIAQSVLSGAPDITKGALFFHSAQAKPGWFKSRPRVGVIGGNVFYR